MSDEVVDLKNQLRLLLIALTKIKPVAESAGILTGKYTAYDEWELIIQALYEAFIVMPICETSLKFNRKMFKMIGFKKEVGTYVICEKIPENELYLDDIRSDDEGVISLYFRGLQDDTNSESIKRDVLLLGDLYVKPIPH